MNPSVAYSERADGPYPMGLMALLATVGMLFAAFTAALLVRRAADDWVPVPLPDIVWANTAVLLCSGGAVELARRAIRRGWGDGAARWLGLASVLGIVFLAGQISAWRVLASRGVFLPSNPHAAFFYVLSAVHGAHVLGGIGALLWTALRAACGAYGAARHAGLTHAAVYWHFMGGVWIYLAILLSVM